MAPGGRYTEQLQRTTARTKVELSNQLHLPQQDDCKTKKYYKKGPNTPTPPPLKMGATINNESTTTEPPP